MTDTESLSAEDKAYFDSRGETNVPAVATPDPAADDPAPDADLPDDLVEDDAAGDPAADPNKPTGQSKVPLAALTKERNERKAVAAKLAETERKAAILEDRWNQILQQREQAAEKEPERPQIDAHKDPLAAVNELLTDLNQRKQTEAERQAQETQTRAAREAWNKTLNTAQTQFKEAATEDADFEPTYVALRMAIGSEFMEAYGLSPQEAKAELDNYEAQQINYAMSRGINVADHMRKLAKARNVVAPAKEPAAKAEDLDKLAEGVNGSTSLSNAGGGRVAATNAQSIADMSPEEFGAWLAKPGNGDKFKKLAGG